MIKSLHYYPAAWREMCPNLLTRALDLVLSFLGCLVLLQVLPVIALLIKLDSRGSVFFKCPRVGKDGKIFDMYKFRTMYKTSRPIGESVSPQGDPRVTPVGRMLRRLKLNELPQFFNLLKGDMTLIGPRPEAPDLAAAYPPEAREILSVKPGLIGPSQIMGRNEEELYPPGVDPKAYYLEHVLPPKLAIDLKYIREKAPLKDLGYLLRGVWVTFTGAVARRHLFDNLSQIILFCCDGVLCLASLTLAHILRFDGFGDTAMDRVFFNLLPWAVLVRLPIFIYGNFYHTLIRHFSYFEVRQIFRNVTLSSVAFLCIAYFLHMMQGYSRGVFLIDWFCLTFCLIGYRALLKHVRYRLRNNNNNDKKRVIIWGAGDYGELCLRYLKKRQNGTYDVIGFIDDDPQKRNRRLNGVRILGDRHHLKIICQLYKVHELFVSIPTIPIERLKPVIEVCQQMGLATKFFTADFVEG